MKTLRLAFSFLFFVVGAALYAVAIALMAVAKMASEHETDEMVQKFLELMESIGAQK